MTSQSTTRPDDAKRLNVAEYPVLAVLNIAPSHGYEVWRYLDDNLGSVWKLGRSQVYALLSQMERDGLLYHERVEQSNLPARKVFDLTDEGRRVLDAWIRQPVYHIRDFRLEFPAKLHFARKQSSEIAEDLLRDQIDTCAGQRMRMEKAQTRCKTQIERSILGYRISILDATVTWLKGLAEAK